MLPKYNTLFFSRLNTMNIENMITEFTSSSLNCSLSHVTRWWNRWVLRKVIAPFFHIVNFWKIIAHSPANFSYRNFT